MKYDFLGFTGKPTEAKGGDSGSRATTSNRNSKAFVALLGACVLQPAAALEVSQTPLTVGEPLPPNIVLMMDDSGSMAWDFMPDSASGLSDEDLRSSEQNKVYYDPSITYTPPFNASGGQYPSLASFPRAPLNGYDPDSLSTSIPSWRSPFSSSSFSTGFPYGIDPQGSCFNGTERSGWEPRLCFSDDSPVSGLEDRFVFYRSSLDTYYYEDDGPSAFVFTNANGETVGVSTDCSDPGVASNIDECVSPSDDSGAAAPQGITAGENVTNWFAYYRTRLLAAKSGLSDAFDALDPAFRVGYGSINGGVYWSNDNDDLLSSPIYSDSYAYLSEVRPFGEGGASSDSRQGLYSWLAGIKANSSPFGGTSYGGTPLRRGLASVGEYFSTDGAWESEGNNYYACRQSFSILISDGYWNGDAAGVGDSDNSDGALITGTDSREGQYLAEKPFARDSGETLADIAAEYWKHDLKEGIDNDVPVTDIDPAFWQHMATFVVGLGVTPQLANDGGGTLGDIYNWARTGSPGNIDVDAFDWGDDKIADMAHAAINGRGSFFSAGNPEEFKSGLRQALAAIANREGAGNSQTFSGGSRLTTDTAQYVSKYVTGQWTGQLQKYGYNADTGDFDIYLWGAAAGIPAHQDRNIWTVASDDKNNPTFAPTALFAGNLDDSQAAALASSVGVSGVDAGDIVSYLRGDRSYEDSASSPAGVALRQRYSLLGDIVSSTPVVVEAPTPDLYDPNNLDFDGIDEYEAFATDYSDRAALVYVAANDGMLHAFDAETGEEVFAFVPGSLLRESGEGNLSRLANPAYGASSDDSDAQVEHQFFHDGEMTTQNVYINGGWKTVLVGTTGRGLSRTIYAIDITDPEVLSDPSRAGEAILWERWAGDGLDKNGNASDFIGMSLGRPTISLVDDGNGEKWVAHVGNGPSSVEGEAALLQFDLATGDLAVYETNNADSMGLAAPYVIQTDSYSTSGKSDYAFAGDLDGNLWRFALDGDGGAGELVYVAKDASGNRQPISARMFVTKNERDGSIWAFFGTGQFLYGEQPDYDGDQNDESVQTWYGLRVLNGNDTERPVVGSQDDRDDLQQREIVVEEAVNGRIGRATSLGDESDLLGDSDAGWYMDLVSPVNGQEGERITYTSQLIAGRMVVNTIIPKLNNPCDTLPAGATLVVDPFTGANPGEAFLDANGDGVINSADSITLNGETLPFNAIRYDVGLAGAFSALSTPSGNVRLYGSTFEGVNFDVEMTPSAALQQRLNWRELYVD